MSRWHSGEPEDSIKITYVIIYGDQFSNRPIFGYYSFGAWYDLQGQLLKKSNILLWYPLQDWTEKLAEKFNKKVGE